MVWCTNFATSDHNNIPAVQTYITAIMLNSVLWNYFMCFNYISSFESNFAGYLKEYIITLHYYRSWYDDIGECHDSHCANTSYFVPGNAFPS